MCMDLAQPGALEQHRFDGEEMQLIPSAIGRSKPIATSRLAELMIVSVIFRLAAGGPQCGIPGLASQSRTAADLRRPGPVPARRTPFSGKCRAIADFFACRGGIPPRADRKYNAMNDESRTESTPKQERLHELLREAWTAHREGNLTKARRAYRVSVKLKSQRGLGVRQAP